MSSNIHCVPDEEYWGRILDSDFSVRLKQRLQSYLAVFSAFEKTATPAISYISAWQEGGKEIWYEYTSRRFVDLMGCHARELAEVFQNSVIDRRIYKYHYVGFDPGIRKEVINQDELNTARSKLREEVKKAGTIEVVYKISVPKDRILWFKDQASLEIYEQDKICLSLGYLTDVTKEMEVEENFQRTEKKLREANRKIERVNFELVKEIAERQRAETELKEANKTLQRLATLDGLTQIANRRQLDERLHQEWERMKREQKPLSLILCDIDFFKLYNDAYGHQSGDNCLCAITQAIHVNVKRAGDLVARYGGEEFAVILPNTNGPQAIHVAELIRKEMLQLAIDHKKSPISPYVTLSLGVACIIPRRELLAGQLVKEADEALYEAKRRGRNRVVLKRFNVPLSS